MRTLVNTPSSKLQTGLRTLAISGLFTILSGCGGTGAPPPDGRDGQPPPVATQVSELNERLNQLEQNQRAALTDLNNRLALIENQTRSIQGHVEEVRHENKGLTERLELYPPQPTNTASPSANVLTASTGDTPAAATKAAEPAAAATPDTKQEAAPAAAAANSKEAYDAAYQKLKQGQYDASLTAFQNFLQTYPSDNMADNAQYWIGELHYVQRRFPEALMAFNQVLLRWPTSSKVPDALLKIGYSFYELNDMDNAHTSLTRLIKDFPNASPATVAKPRLAQIKQKLRQ